MSTDALFTPAPYDPGIPDLFPETNALQGPVDDKYYTQYGGSLAGASTGHQKGGVTRIRFSEPCTITHIGVFLMTTHGGGSHDYRLGIYENNMGEPGDLAVDAGTLNIPNNATVGMKEITLATPYEVSAYQTVWLASKCDNTSNFPFLALHANGRLKPYTEYGMVSTSYYTLTPMAFALIGSGSTALPDPFTLGTPEVHGHTPAVFVKVSVGS